MDAIKTVWWKAPSTTGAKSFSWVLIAALMLAVGPRAANAQANVDGVWSPVSNWPLIAVHAAMTPDGRVLTYGTDGAGKQTGYFIYDIWDPSAGLEGGHFTLNNMTLTDIFCSSQVILPQSEEILIAGGDNWTGTGTTNTGNNNSNLFDWTDNTLARSNNMNRARWYSSATVLVDGSIYIQGGTGGADRPEVREDNGTYRLLTNVPTNGFAALFPRNFLAPDGRVFGYDTAGRMYFVSTGGTGSIATVGQFPSANAGWTSGAAMFRPGKILQTGGNSNGAIVIDINGPQPTITATQSASTRRQWVSATVLPDGKVLGTGGSQVENQLSGVNNSAEIWDPATGTWHRGSDGALARLYHSAALLLPDATVLIAGGGAPGPLRNTNAEIYYPPYLFDDDGELAPRPQILNAPSSVDVGDTLAIEVNASISRVTIVKSGSVTHSVNMDQRFIELPFTAQPGSVYASLPVRASDTPPGFYHLFVIDAAGVPSQASMLKINVDSTPNTAVDYTSTIGGGGGAPFQLACDANQVLVGVHGRFATYVNQVGPQCVAVDQFGRWIGDPVTKPVTGTTASGTTFNKLCPRDSAMSGFRGRSAQYVDQIDIECRALTPSGGLSGPGQFLGAVGGPGGSAQGLASCGTGNPVYALYGRSGGWLDAFGVQCRPAAITPIATNSSPVLVNPGPQSSIVGIAVDLQIQASDGDNDPLVFDIQGLPPGLVASPQARITGTPTTAGTYAVTVAVTDGTESANVAFTWLVEQVEALAVEPMTPQPPSPTDTSISYTATAHGGINVRYKWQFGDGTPETPYSASPTITHAYSSPGIYFITLTVTDDLGVPSTQTFAQTIHLPLTAAPARNSSSIAYDEAGGGRLWVVNQDNDSVSAFDLTTSNRLAEIPVGAAPRAVAVAPDGSIWVTNKRDSSISIVSPATLGVTQTIALPRGAEPFGLVFSAVSNQAFVVLEGLGELVVLDASTGGFLASADVGEHARHVSIDGAGETLYVSRFITPPQPGEDTATVASDIGGVPAGGEVLVLDAVTLTPAGTIVLRHSDKADAENQGSGVPNYLGAVAISPDGASATVPSKLDNIARGTLRSGANLNFQNTVRAVTSRIDIGTGVEDFGRRIDHDNASLVSAVAYDPFGIYMFVALETSREVAVVDAHGGFEIFRVEVGRAPQGLVVSPDGTRLYVSNFMDRTIDVLDITDLAVNGQWNISTTATWTSIGTEKLDPTVLLGKQLFYDAKDTRLARDRYMSCASCHNDGGYDGRVWDLTGMGEGLRNTISLRGTAAAHGSLHWSQNFDEVQDFEGQIRALAGGTGLMPDSAFFFGSRSTPLGDPKAGISSDLDALAAYVASLDVFPVSPHRDPDGSLTPEGEAGRAVFMRENCAACHADAPFTDSAADNLHDIGTVTSASGSRLGAPLTGIDTPTLRAVWRTSPYLHDGSAQTLADAVAAHSGVAINPGDMAVLVEYLKQIDANELIAPQPAVLSSVWDASATPAIAAAQDSSPVQLGVKFRASVDGFVTGVRFYKGPGNTGTHVGKLWNTSGGQLASAVFTNETETGWQQVNFDVPVPITAGTVYVASYHAPNGHYSADIAYFRDSGVNQGPLYLLRDGENGGNGVYAYGTVNTYPSASFNSANYWVDIVFSNGEVVPPNDTTAPSVISQSPASGNTNASPTTSVTATFSEPMDAVTVNTSTFELRDATNSVVPGIVSYDAASRTATLVPSAELAAASTYTATVRGGTADPRAKDAAGNALAADVAWSFTTRAAADCPCSGWDGGASPAMVSAPDSNAVELGVKFRVDVDGVVTGIRFYKGAGNTGEHIGNLWSNSGQLLATAIFTNETASGWQQVDFAQPVAVTADTVYVASYHAPNGHYSANSAYFANSGIDRGVLHLLQDGVSGSNGLYVYSASSAFPTQSYNSSNYWVDVVFDDDAGEPPVDNVPPTVLSVSPASGALNVTTGTNVTVTFNEAIDPTTIGPDTFELRDASSLPVPATVSFNAATRTATLNPGADLDEAASYTVTVRGGVAGPRVRDLAGNALANDVVWSFTTAAAIACPCSAWDATSVPQVPAAQDSGSVELGVKLRIEVDGFITGIRFYKGLGNTGQHVGNLWTATGELLATAVFTNETASGWQEVTFAAPVAVSAGTVYVASYHAPNGNYSADAAYFANDGVDGGVLRLLRNGESGGNGVYAYGTGSLFPNSSYNSNNYWVDVVFVY